VKVDEVVWNMGMVEIGAGRRALAVCGSRTVSLWDVNTFGAGDSLLGRYDVNWAMDMAVVPATDTSPNLLVTTEKNLVRVIDPQDGAAHSKIRLGRRIRGQVARTSKENVYSPTGVRFGDGAAGFAVTPTFGRIEVWRLSGRKLTSREFLLSGMFNVGGMVYLPAEGGHAWLAVAAGRGIEMWDLDTGSRLARSELDIPISALASVPLAGRMLVAAAFGVDQESGVLLWDPATGQPVTGLFNRHGPAFGDPIRIGLEIHAVIAVPYPDGTVRIASAGTDGMIRVSPPLDNL
jgi:WD40 repeat protein